MTHWINSLCIFTYQKHFSLTTWQAQKTFELENLVKINVTLLLYSVSFCSARPVHLGRTGVTGLNAASLAVLEAGHVNENVLEDYRMVKISVQERQKQEKRVQWG